MVGCGGHLLPTRRYGATQPGKPGGSWDVECAVPLVPWTGVNAQQIASCTRLWRNVELLLYFPGGQLPPSWVLWGSRGQLAGNRRFSGTDGYGAHDERKRRGSCSTGGFPCRLPQCQIMTSAVHERRPHRRGSNVGCRKRDCRRRRLRWSTEHGAHTWSCQKSSCPSIQGHGSCAAANGGRAAAWAVDEAQAHCTRQTNGNGEPGPASRWWRRGEGGRWLRQGLGTWS